MTNNLEMTKRKVIIRSRELEVGLDELTDFIVEAKKSCYAGNGEEKEEEDGSRILTFQKGNFHYTDNYAGYFQAPGTEIVRWQRPNGQRIWQMSYSGEMLLNDPKDNELTKETFAFLKKALSQITEKKPFRGPEETGFSDGDFFYSADTMGDLVRFIGHEKITNKKIARLVFSQDYIGGLVIPK